MARIESKKPIPHGGSGNGYSNRGCRCELCTKANRERCKKRSIARSAEVKDPNDPRHGKASFYINHGCRCQPCTTANTDYARSRR